MNQLLSRLGKILLAYTLITCALYFIVNSWLMALAYGILGFFAFSYIVNSVKELIGYKFILRRYLVQLEDLRKQLIVQVNCAFCGKINAVPFRMDERVEFECEHCKKLNLLMINVGTAQVTVPLATSKSNPVTETKDNS